MAEADVKDSIRIPVDRIFPNEWNPNEQRDETFNALVAEIEEDGFDHWIQVVPWPDCPHVDKSKGEFKWGEGEGESCSGFKIIGGEHRWKAVTVLEWDDVPCVVYTDWDERVQKLKTVRRNLLSGDLNAAKFTRLVQGLEDDGMEKAVIAEAMGFHNEAAFLNELIQDKEEREKTWLDALQEENKKEVEAVDSMSDLLNNIFSKYGDTVPQSFLFFMFKGKTHLLVMMDAPLYSEVDQMVTHLKDTGQSSADFFKDALKRERSSRTATE